MKTINKVALATVVLFTTLNGLNEVSAIYTGTEVKLELEHIAEAEL